MQHQFIGATPDKEPLLDKPCNAALVDEYIENDAERANSNIGQVIYDSVDASPNYEGTPGDLYIDEKDLIELPVQQQNDGAINEPYQKRYTFSTLNLPYSMEQPYSYSAK